MIEMWPYITVLRSYNDTEPMAIEKYDSRVALLSPKIHS